MLSLTVSPLIAACSGGNNVSVDGMLLIAADGGTVTSEDGKLSLEIPAGVLEEDATIRIATAAVAATDLPAGEFADGVPSTFS